jgi:hypothetical protein
MTATVTHNNTTPSAARPPAQATATPRLVPTTLEPLIREIWSAGIATGASGPDDGYGCAWIEFRAASSLRDFLNVAVVCGTSAYTRLPWTGGPDASGRPWAIETWVEDRARYPESDDPDWPEVDRPPEFRLTHTLHVPHGDLPEVMARLRGHNRAAR